MKSCIRLHICNFVVVLIYTFDFNYFYDILNCDLVCYIIVSQLNEDCDVNKRFSLSCPDLNDQMPSKIFNMSI